MSSELDDFHRRVSTQWAKAIESLGLCGPTSTTWRDFPAIEQAIQPFMGDNFNHAHLPTGGGLNFLSINHSRERGCLETMTTSRSADVFKPQALTFEHFPRRPQESFLLLELAPLAPSGVYEHNDYAREELVEIPDDGYMPREVWDQGYLRHDEEGREVPIPDEARLVTRWFGGKILIVAKGSVWNNTPETYDGRHNQMTSVQIRKAIEQKFVLP